MNISHYLDWSKPNETEKKTNLNLMPDANFKWFSKLCGIECWTLLLFRSPNELRLQNVCFVNDDYQPILAFTNKIPTTNRLAYCIIIIFHQITFSNFSFISYGFGMDFVFLFAQLEFLTKHSPKAKLQNLKRFRFEWNRFCLNISCTHVKFFHRKFNNSIYRPNVCSMQCAFTSN